VLDDGMLQQQSIERFRKVMAPKVQGSWNLHLYTKDLPLDFFICFSSAASLVGSPGQSNYAAGNAFMDALCQHRRALGLPGLSINWGAWSDAGMAGNEQTLQRMAARGVAPINPQQGLELLAGLLRSDLAQIGVFPVDWSKFLEQFPRGIPPLFEGLGQIVKKASLTLAGSRETRERQLRAHLHDELARVLGFDPTMQISSRQGFFDLGMDSLMAVELKSRLEVNLSIALPATIAFDYPTLDALGGYISDLLSLGNPSDAAAGSSELDSMSAEEISRLLAQELEEDGVHAG
jgi:myxalamid-type polyketide synthase MxaB